LLAPTPLIKRMNALPELVKEAVETEEHHG
jgi:hypothetical protein